MYKSKEYRPQQSNEKRTNHDLQNITQKTKDQSSLIPLKNRGAPEG